MNVIDISWPIEPTTTAYKDRRTITIAQLKTFDIDQVRESIITCGSHTGTHIDAPAHFLKEGKTVDQLSLDTFIGACTVLDLTQVTEKIGEHELQDHLIKEDDIILFKTKNSGHLPTNPFDYQFVYLDESGARYLARKKIKAVGIDYLGIERNQPHHMTHITLMQADIGILEGLRLAHVTPGTYTLIALPLHLIGLEAAQARAILVK